MPDKTPKKKKTKKIGRPLGSKSEKVVRIELNTYTKAVKVAEWLGISTAEYLSDTLRRPVARDYMLKRPIDGEHIGRPPDTTS